MTACLDHDHRLHAGSRAGRRHELAHIGDQLDVHQDRPGAAVEGEIVEEVAEIDVDGVPDRGDPGKADRPAGRPFHEPRRYAPRLRNKREIADLRLMHREAGVEARARHEQAQTVGSEEPQTMRSRRLPRLLGERARPVAEPGGDHDGRGNPARTSARNQAGDFGRRRGHDHQIGGGVERLDVRNGSLSVDLRVAGIDDVYRAFEPCLAQIAEHDPAQRELARTCAHHRNGAGGKQRFQSVSAHQKRPLSRRNQLRAGKEQNGRIISEPTTGAVCLCIDQEQCSQSAAARSRPARNAPIMCRSCDRPSSRG